MTVSENELPFDVEADPYTKETLDPGFYDKIIPHDLMNKQVTPFFIKTGIHNCFACDMKQFHKPLELSNFEAPVMIIGETPSDVDFKTKEGKLLADTLTWAKYDLENIYFTSLIKCEDGGSPVKCQHHLLSEILCVRPQMIIALGYDVGKYFDPSINTSGYTSNLLDRYEMITTYRTKYVMSDQAMFQEYCNHMLRAKQQVESKLQRSP